MIDTIIFDIGEVLIHFRWREYIKELGFSEEIQKRVEMATVHSPWWKENDRGMPKEEYEKGMISMDPEIEPQLKEFFAHTEHIMEEYDYSENLLKNLKEQGYHVYLLSNYGEFQFIQASAQWKFLKYTDGRVVSYEIHSLKPDPEIYETLLEKYQIDREHAVFLDDHMANVEGARRVNLNAIQFQSLEQAKEELKKYGVVVGA